MTPLDAVALVASLALGFHWLISRQLALAQDIDPRRCGIVIVRERALDSRSEPVGEYCGQAIPGTVTFHGFVYRFDRVLAPELRDRIGPGELYLEPGLVFVIDAASARDA